jgi:hypothetical protein
VDGLSERIHGNSSRARRDTQLREALDSKGYRVLAIAATQLDDRGAVRAHLRRLAKALDQRDSAETLRTGEDWWKEPTLVVSQGTDQSASAATNLPPQNELQFVGAAARGLLEAAVRLGASLPQIGYELLDEGAAGWPIEAAWPQVRVAVIIDSIPERDRWLEEHGWDARHADHWTPEALRSAILARTD